MVCENEWPYGLWVQGCERAQQSGVKRRTTASAPAFSRTTVLVEDGPANTHTHPVARIGENRNGSHLKYVAAIANKARETRLAPPPSPGGKG